MTGITGMAKTHYDILQLKIDASSDDIRSAYKKLAFKHHPDKNKENDDTYFKQISKAYSILSDNDLRTEYNRSLDIIDNCLVNNNTSNQTQFIDIFATDDPTNNMFNNNIEHNIQNTSDQTITTTKYRDMNGNIVTQKIIESKDKNGVITTKIWDSLTNNTITIN